MGARRLLVSDLDGTLIGDRAALDRFSRWLEPRRSGYAVVYASGRHRPLIESGVREEGLPRPDAMISAVGTEIHDDAGRPWPGWLEQFEPTYGERVRGALRAVRWLEPQPLENQSNLKSSYEVAGLSDRDRSTIRRALADAGIQATIVYSGGRYLDLIPVGSGKGTAARFLADAWGIADDGVLAFGDSGNDLELLGAGFRATIVANALPELVSAAPADAYHSPRPFADGVLDGIRFWSTPRAVDERQGALSGAGGTVAPTRRWR